MTVRSSYLLLSIAVVALIAPAVADSSSGETGTAKPTTSSSTADRRGRVVTVSRDVDGDTVFVRYRDGSEGYVRLIGIDTPEDVKPGSPVECGAEDAARWMKREAAGRTATLVADPTQDEFDVYGRRLAYLYVDGRNLDLRSVRAGWAEVYVFDDRPFGQLRSFRRAEAEASHEAVGIWRLCGGDFHTAAGRSSMG